MHALDGAVEKAMDDLSGKFTEKRSNPQPKAVTKTKRALSETLKALSYCGGSDETRTRGLLRDRQAF